MRLLEVSIITIASMSLILAISFPLIETSYYEQQFILANDIFNALYKETNGTLYYEESYQYLYERINEISNELDLCIYFKNNFYEIKTCEIEKGSYIESSHPYGKLIIGVGK